MKEASKMRTIRSVALPLALLATVLVAAKPAGAQPSLAQPGGGPHVRLFGPGGGLAAQWFAYGQSFQGGVRVATAPDVVVTGAGPGGGPDVRVFNPQGGTIASFLPYDGGFRGGVHVAVGDVDGDGQLDIVTGAGPGGGPHVRVFGLHGQPKASFFPYGTNFAGGVRVAVGDVTGNGVKEIITGAGAGGGPHVRVFTGGGAPLNGFMAYDASFPGGVHVAAGDVDGDGVDDIVTGAGPTGGPHVRVFSGSGGVKAGFFAYGQDFAGGVTVAAAPLLGGSGAQIVTGAGAGGGPHVRVFNPQGGVVREFFAYDAGYPGGVNVAAGQLGGQARIVTGAGAELAYPVLRRGDGGPYVHLLQRRLEALRYWVGPVNGSYGLPTQHAVFAFQKYTGLPVTGVFGAAEWRALFWAGVPIPASGPGSGTLVEVDKTRQLLFVVDDGRVRWAFHTATGREVPFTRDGRVHSAVTPTGRFTLFRQIDGWRTSHLGRLYRPKYFTNVGHAIHGYTSVPTSAGSAGCVRVSLEAMDYIWNHGVMPLGTPLWVYGAVR